MQIVDVKNVDVKVTEGGPVFTGGKIYSQFVINEKHGAEKIHIGMIKFAPGARNKFHTHNTEQILFVTEGKGIVATQDKEYVVTPGMVIFVPPGEVHWHGATKDSPFTHLAVIGQPHEMVMVEK